MSEADGGEDATRMAGHASLEAAAVAISGLRHDALRDLLAHLGRALEARARDERERRRPRVAGALELASLSMQASSSSVGRAWDLAQAPVP